MLGIPVGNLSREIEATSVDSSSENRSEVQDGKEENDPVEISLEDYSQNKTENPTSSLDTKLVSKVGDVKNEMRVQSFHCELTLNEQCRTKVFSSLSSLRIHYSVHFRTSLERKYVDKATGNKCLECQTVINEKLKLVAHIGAHHKKIDCILKNKGIVLEPRRNKHANLPSASLNQTVSETSAACNYDLKCQVCNESFKILSDLTVHVCRHFRNELENKSTDLTSTLTCKLCGTVFSAKKNLIIHIGSKHGKINEILVEKGFKVLPCSLTGSTKTKSEETQKYLEEVASASSLTIKTESDTCDFIE